MRLAVRRAREAPECLVPGPFAPLREGQCASAVPAPGPELEMITGAQIRQGRELLGWRQAELAKKAKVETHFVESAESSDTVSFVPVGYLDAMRGALEDAGVEFTNADRPGVKLR